MLSAQVQQAKLKIQQISAHFMAMLGYIGAEKVMLATNPELYSDKVSELYAFMDGINSAFAAVAIRIIIIQEYTLQIGQLVHDLIQADPVVFSQLCIRLINEKFVDVEMLFRVPGDKDRMTRYPTLLHLGAAMGRRDICDALIKAGAQLDRTDAHGQDHAPLHLAVYHGRMEICELLLDRDTNVNVVSILEQVTPLHLASYCGHSEIVDLLITHKANIEAINRYRQSPLHLAAFEGHTTVCARLIAAGAEVNAKDHRNNTPAHIAAEFVKNPAIYQFLVDHGADIHAANKVGQTPETLHLYNHNQKEYLKRMKDKPGNRVTIFKHEIPVGDATPGDLDRKFSALSSKGLFSQGQTPKPPTPSGDQVVSRARVNPDSTETPEAAADTGNPPQPKGPGAS